MKDETDWGMVYDWVVEAIQSHLYSEQDLVQFQFDNLLDHD